MDPQREKVQHFVFYLFSLLTTATFLTTTQKVKKMHKQAFRLFIWKMNLWDLKMKELAEKWNVSFHLAQFDVEKTLMMWN